MERRRLMIFESAHVDQLVTSAVRTLKYFSNDEFGVAGIHIDVTCLTYKLYRAKISINQVDHPSHMLIQMDYRSSRHAKDFWIETMVVEFGGKHMILPNGEFVVGLPIRIFDRSRICLVVN